MNEKKSPNCGVPVFLFVSLIRCIRYSFWFRLDGCDLGVQRCTMRAVSKSPIAMSRYFQFDSNLKVKEKQISKQLKWQINILSPDEIDWTNKKIKYRECGERITTSKNNKEQQTNQSKKDFEQQKHENKLKKWTRTLKFRCLRFEFEVGHVLTVCAVCSVQCTFLLPILTKLWNPQNLKTIKTVKEYELDSTSKIIKY